MKLGIIVDSSCGLSQKEATKRKWGYLPLLVNIDGKEFKDGVDIKTEEFYNTISIEMDVRTSATPPGLIVEEYERMSKEFDHVIVYGLSTELSSQSSNLAVFAKEFNNIHVVNSKGVGAKVVYDLEKVIKLAEEKKDIKELLDVANNLSSSQCGMALPTTLKWLIKGGRINPAIAQLAKLFKVVPMLSFTNGKLERYGKGKDFLKTVIESSKIIANMCDENENLYIYHGGNQDILEIKKMIEDILSRELVTVYMPPVIALHTGPGIISIMGTKKI